MLECVLDSLIEREGERARDILMSICNAKTKGGYVRERLFHAGYDNAGHPPFARFCWKKKWWASLYVYTFHISILSSSWTNGLYIQKGRLLILRRRCT